MDELDLGPFRGAVAQDLRNPALVHQLATLADLLEAGRERRRPFARNRLVRVELACGAVAVKVFAAQGPLGSGLARRFGSKARRSWEVARALYERTRATPRPVAYLERWEKGRLRESFFLAEQVDDTSTLHAELIRIYREEPDYARLLDLIETVAGAVRRMHDAGILHGDMGNQNIFLRRMGESGWTDVRFIDLNRGRVRERALGLRARAFDLSRLTLPSRLRYLFSLMYYRERFFAGRRAPRGLVRWERFFRLRFALHTKSRTFRHPLKSFRRWKAGPKKLTYPAAQDLWLWDAHTSQAAGVWMRSEKLLHTSPAGLLRIAAATLLAAVPVGLGLRRARRAAYKASVAMEGRIGMTVSPTPESAKRERELLRPFGPIPLLARFCRHEGPARWEFVAKELRRLHEAGHPVSIALVQDRRAVKEPALWRAFLFRVLERVGDFIDEAELGHATNRVKWGVWSPRDHARLLRPLPELKAQYPRVRWLGPAINDFEYAYLLSGLACLPRGERFDALSLHLYMDRSGPPEGGQLGFSGLDKFLLPKALARISRRCAERVVVTEVNWPLGKEGGQSHAFAPYCWIGNPKLDTTADLEAYADYMVRYYLHALCSGGIDRVFWWKLVGQSFGLVDDREHDPARWRPRPAYAAFRTLLELLGDATFRAQLAREEGTFLLRFTKPDGREVVAAWSARGEREAALPFLPARVLDRDGAALDAAPRKLTGRPIYLVAGGA